MISDVRGSLLAFAAAAAILLAGVGEAICKEQGAKLSAAGQEAAGPGFAALDDDMNLLRLQAAVSQSLRYFGERPSEREFAFSGRVYTSGDYRRVLTRLVKFLRTGPSEVELGKWLRKHLDVIPASAAAPPGRVLFTGYYTPLLNGSRTRSDVYPYPLYDRPDDLVTFRPADFCTGCPASFSAGRLEGKRLVPYPTREILTDSDVLSRVSRPIVYVDDPVDLFFLHIQGSGMVRLPDGELINVHYAASNGHRYGSIGRYLIDSKRIARKDLTMPAIRAYLKNHPEKRRAVFSRNPRYVFFKEEDGGPRGCLGVELTPGRSIAMDQEVYPPGALAFIRCEKPVLDPDGEVSGWAPFSRIVLNQDAGDAIRGKNRVDIYWGGGRYAETAAGRLKHRGDLYILVPKTGSTPSFSSPSPPPS
jgi:membrane-bound lytic murein transglycosylase A